jgi:hypothetical protein
LATPEIDSVVTLTSPGDGGDQARIDEIVKMATGESALGALRRLRALDDERR